MEQERRTETEDKAEPKPVQTEKMTVDGLDVTVEQNADSTIAVKLPAGLSEDERAEFIKKVETGSNLVGSLYKKLKSANEEKRSLAEREKALDEREAKLNNASTPEKDNTIKPVWEILGLTSEGDEEDFAIDHPVQYQKAVLENMKKTARFEAQKEAEARNNKVMQELHEHTLAQRITTAGADPDDVKAFAKYYSIPYGEKAFELYAKQNSLKTDPIIDAQLEAQRKQVTWIESGNKPSIKGLVAKFKENPNDISDEELDVIIAARKKEFNQ